MIELAWIAAVVVLVFGALSRALAECHEDDAPAPVAYLPPGPARYQLEVRCRRDLELRVLNDQVDRALSEQAGRDDFRDLAVGLAARESWLRLLHPDVPRDDADADTDRDQQPESPLSPTRRAP